MTIDDAFGILRRECKMKMNGIIHFWPQKWSPSPHQQKCIIKIGGGYFWKKMANPNRLALNSNWTLEEGGRMESKKPTKMYIDVGRNWRDVRNTDGL